MKAIMSGYLLKGGWQLKEKEFGHKAQEGTEEWLSKIFFFLKQQISNEVYVENIHKI